MAWKTADNYRRSAFYTTASDKSGHSSLTSRMRIPPSLNARIASIINSGAFPQLRTPHDFWRDAAHHRLHDLAELANDPKLQNEVRAEIERAALATRIANARNELAEQKQILKDLDDFMREAKDVPFEWIEAQLKGYRQTAENLNEPFRTRVSQEIERYLAIMRGQVA